MVIVCCVEGRTEYTNQSEISQHLDLMAKLIADGLADSCSQVIVASY